MPGSCTRSAGRTPDRASLDRLVARSTTAQRSGGEREDEKRDDARDRKETSLGCVARLACLASMSACTAARWFSPKSMARPCVRGGNTEGTEDTAHDTVDTAGTAGTAAMGVARARDSDAGKKKTPRYE